MMRVKKMDITFRLATLLLIVVVLCPSISAGAYKPPSSVNLGILATEISPQPARPGEDMFVKISIQNYGNNPAEDVTLDLEEFFPFHFKYSNTGYTGYGESKHYTSTAIMIPKISAYSSYEAYYYFTVDPLAKSGEYELTFNKSINQSLSRTIITSFTTLLSLFALYFFGGSILRDFAFALIVGVIVGTYSSVFVASALVVDWHRFKPEKMKKM